MGRIFISHQFALGQIGHENYSFVDVAVNADNKLFIDPCLIELNKDRWCVEAKGIVLSFLILYFLRMSIVIHS